MTRESQDRARQRRLSRFCHVFRRDGVMAFFHALSMELIYLDGRTGERIVKGLRSEIGGTPLDAPEALVGELERLQFIVPVERNEIAELAEVVTRLSESGYLTILYLILTDYCNLRCTYCFIETPVQRESLPLFRGTGRMTPKIAEQALDTFARLTTRYAAPDAERLIQLYGGEPLLNFPTIEYAARYAERLVADGKLPGSTKLVVITNGVLVTEPIATFLAAHGIAVGLSLDGPQEETDAYRQAKDGRSVFGRAVAGFRLLKRCGVKVGVSCTLTPRNLINFDRTLEFLLELGVEEGVSFNILHAPPGLEVPENYYREAARCIIRAFEVFRERGIYEERFMRKLRAFVKREPLFSDCGVTGNQIVVAPDGRIGVCQDFVKTRRYFPAHVSDPIWDPVDDPIFQEWRTRSPLKMEPCLSCPALGICGGGCPASVELVTGNKWEVDKRICPHSLLTLEWLVWEQYQKLSEKRVARKSAG